MSTIQVDTERIQSAATVLQTVNSTLDRKFETLGNKTRNLDRDWVSAASSAAMTAMYEIFRGNEARSAALRNCADALNRKINPDWIQSETANTQLADLFK